MVSPAGSGAPGRPTGPTGGTQHRRRLPVGVAGKELIRIAIARTACLVYSRAVADNVIGTWIRGSRKARNWNQTQVGLMLGVSQVRVSQWETGKLAPTAEELRKLEIAFAERAPVASPDAAVAASEAASHTAPPRRPQASGGCQTTPAGDPVEGRREAGSSVGMTTNRALPERAPEVGELVQVRSRRDDPNLFQAPFRAGIKIDAYRARRAADLESGRG